MAVYVSVIDNMGNATGADLTHLDADFIVQEGILESDHLTVEQNGTPDLSVNVTAGVCYVQNDAWTEFNATAPKYWRVLVDATTNVSISSNASGSTRIDLVCIKVDDSIAPGTNGELAGSVVVVEGTAGAGTPALPADHLLRATVTITSGASSILDADIANETQKALIDGDKINAVAPAQTITYSSTPTVNWSLGKTAYITLTGNPTFTFSGGVSGEKYILVLKQDGTGSRTITLPASVRTGDIGTPTLSTAGGSVDYIGFIYNGIDSKYDLVSYSLGM